LQIVALHVTQKQLETLAAGNKGLLEELTSSLHRGKFGASHETFTIPVSDLPALEFWFEVGHANPQALGPNPAAA
jgi:hypothetical protein